MPPPRKQQTRAERDRIKMEYKRLQQAMGRAAGATQQRLLAGPATTAATERSELGDDDFEWVDFRESATAYSGKQPQR